MCQEIHCKSQAKPVVGHLSANKVDTFQQIIRLHVNCGRRLGGGGGGHRPPVISESNVSNL